MDKCYNLSLLGIVVNCKNKSWQNHWSLKWDAHSKLPGVHADPDWKLSIGGFYMEKKFRIKIRMLQFSYIHSYIGYIDFQLIWICFHLNVIRWELWRLLHKEWSQDHWVCSVRSGCYWWCDAWSMCREPSSMCASLWHVSISLSGPFDSFQYFNDSLLEFLDYFPLSPDNEAFYQSGISLG